MDRGTNLFTGLRRQDNDHCSVKHDGSILSWRCKTVDIDVDMAMDPKVLWSVVLMEGTCMVELQQAGTFLSAERAPSPGKLGHHELSIRFRVRVLAARVQNVIRFVGDASSWQNDDDGVTSDLDSRRSDVVSRTSCRDGSLPTGTTLDSFEMSKVRPTVLHAGSGRKDRGGVAPVERSLTWMAVDSEAAESLIGKWLAWSSTMRCERDRMRIQRRKSFWDEGATIEAGTASTWSGVGTFVAQGQGDDIDNVQKRGKRVVTRKQNPSRRTFFFVF
jgi:hypothetical protein